MVRFAEDDTYGGQDATYDGQQEYGGQDWAQEGAYDEAAYTQPTDEAGGAYGADAAYSQHVADDANDYGGQNTAALGSEALAEEENERFGSLGKFACFEISFRALRTFTVPQLAVKLPSNNTYMYCSKKVRSTCSDLYIEKMVVRSLRG